MAHFRISPDRAGTFRSRIKQLQRMEFPSGVNIGRGAKMSYGAEHLVKIALAFELIGAGYPAMLATSTIEGNWRKFSAAVALDYRNRFSLYLLEDVFVRIIAQTFSDLQFRHAGGREGIVVMVEDHTALCDILKRHSNRAANGYTIICITDFITRLMKIAEEIGGVPDALYDLEIVDWLVSTIDKDGKHTADKEWIQLAGQYKKSNFNHAFHVFSRIYNPERAGELVEILKASGEFDGNS